jgi:NADPH2:quinone reductase
MKALVCKTLGSLDDLRVEEVPAPVAGKGEVVIDIKAAGVNFPDLLIVQGKYQARPALPFAPGGEFAGFVAGVGEGVDRFRMGDAVLALSTHGGFAQQAAIDAASVLALPRGSDLAVAAALMYAHGTALHALKDRAQLARGETLLVLGAAGGVGLAAVEIGKLLGATVIAGASTDAKLEVAQSRGADHTINYEREDLKERVREITAGRGVDVVYDPVGGALAETALRSVAWNGRFLVIGFASGEIPKIPLNLPLLKGVSIVGVFWGSFLRNEPGRAAQNARDLLQWVAQGSIAPLITARYPLERAVDALRAIERRQAVGKIVIEP